MTVDCSCGKFDSVLLTAGYESKFIAECFMHRGFILGFTGSVGTAVVTED